MIPTRNSVRPRRGDAMGRARPPALRPAHLACRHEQAMIVHARRSMRLGEEEEVVEQLLCPEMTRWRWSSTRRRSCGSGRGTSGGCAVQNAASPTLVWSKIAMPDGTTRLGRARGRAARAESLGVKRRPSHARCALLLSHDVMMTAYTLFFF